MSGSLGLQNVIILVIVQFCRVQTPPYKSIHMEKFPQNFFSSIYRWMCKKYKKQGKNESTQYYLTTLYIKNKCRNLRQEDYPTSAANTAAIWQSSHHSFYHFFSWVVILHFFHLCLILYLLEKRLEKFSSLGIYTL